MTSAASTSPEFSRVVSVIRIGSTPAKYPLKATPAECAALARRFDLVSLDRFVANVSLWRQADGGIRLDADFEADAVQSSVVTLEPIPAQVADSFTIIFRADIDEEEADRLALENPEDEILEPLMGDSIDIAEAVAQQLSLTLDPYPRLPGTQSTVAESAADGEDEPLAERRNPFDALESLKKRS